MKKLIILTMLSTMSVGMHADFLSAFKARVGEDSYIEVEGNLFLQ